MKWLIAILGLIYFFLPMDLFPDLIAGLGWLDDIMLLGVIWYLFFRRPSKIDDRSDTNRRSESDASGRHSHASDSGSGETSRQTHDDPYSVLGVPSDASQEDIRIAYRLLAAQYHPDKLAHLGDEFQALAEQKFKAIQAAYETLQQRR